MERHSLAHAEQAVAVVIGGSGAGPVVGDLEPEVVVGDS